MKTIFIEGHRSGYHPEQCEDTMTIDTLIEYLENLKEEYGLDGDTPIYLRNDNGYTYGHINDRSIYGGIIKERSVETVELEDLAYMYDEEDEDEEE